VTRERIYLAFTPYHVLLALALQHRDDNPDACVLFADEAAFLSHAPGIAAALRKHVELRTAPTLEAYPPREYPVRSRLAARWARRFVEAAGPPREIFVSNGLRPESQRLFRSLKGRTSFKFVEDGFDSYIAVNRDDVARWHRAAHRMLCGSIRARSHDMVSAFPYESYNVIAPEFCRAPATLIDPIPVESLRRATEIMQAALPLPAPARPITDLYLLANSERMPDPVGYVGEMRAWVAQRVADDPTTYIAVKAHPREKDRRLMAAVHDLGDYTIPHWVPAELLTGHLNPSGSVHCGLTTFIVSSRQLLPQRRLYLDQTVRPEHVEIVQRWDPTITSDTIDLREQPVDRTIVTPP
jgi:hypothetical protein